VIFSISRSGTYISGSATYIAKPETYISRLATPFLPCKDTK
jgi:hypothetical protein